MNPDLLPKIVAVVGPTATGKTALGVAIAQMFDGEIISADAKQLYRGMDVGTAKEKILPVPQHLIDVSNPGERVTVGRYQALAYAAIDDCLGRQKVPVLVGGSGLYAEAVLEGYLFEGAGSQAKLLRYQSLRLALLVERDELRRRVKERLLGRKELLITEIKTLLAAGIEPGWLISCGLEYRAFTLLAVGTINEQEAVEQTLKENYAFIKRQYTWWRRDPSVVWVNTKKQALKAASLFLEKE